MPTNLNALIRYKAIDKDLQNTYVDSTIVRLQQICSDALAEYRGIYKLVSERTIRDDIRVMRSEALDFNAPIVVKNGVYSYEYDYAGLFKTDVNSISVLDDLKTILENEYQLGNIKSDSYDRILKELDLRIVIHRHLERLQSPRKLRRSRRYSQEKRMYSDRELSSSSTIAENQEVQQQTLWELIFNAIQ